MIIAKVIGPEMVSRNVRSTPLVVGTQRDKRPPLHIGWWLGVGVSGLLAAALAIVKSPIWGLGPFIVFAVLLAMVLLMRAGGSNAIRLGGGRRLGKGPHRTYEAVDETDFAEQMLEAMETGREMAMKRDWDFDWAEFDHEFDAGRSSLKQGDPKKALRSMAKASTILRTLFQTEQRKAIG